MITLILLSALLLVVQLILPALLMGPQHLGYLLSSREKSVEPSAAVGRAMRASKNYQETYPVFLALALLSVTLEVNIEQAASTWLICRVMFLVVYVLGINYVRTLVWFGSIISLVYMALPFIKG